MKFNWFNWKRDGKEYPKLHPTQKPIGLLKELIEIFTDKGDVVIDPVAGSGSTLRASYELRRNSYGFEIKKDFCKEANEKMLDPVRKIVTIEDIIEEEERQKRIAKYQKKKEEAESGT